MENFEDLEKLLEQGADPNTELLSTKMPTALMKESRDGNLKLVKLLLDYGANSSIKNYQDETALVLAVSNRNLNVRAEIFEIIKLLLEKDPNPQNQNLAKAIIKSIFWENQYIRDYLINYDPQYVIDHGKSILMAAVRSGSVEFIRNLLDRGLEIYASEALVNVNNLEKAKLLLLSYDANPNYQDENGQTALMNASRNGNIEIIRFLLENGANPNLRDQYGWSVLKIAQLLHQDEIVQLLQSYGAR